MRRAARATVVAVVAAAGSLAACTFDPNIPSARILCYTTADCPGGYGCETVTTAAGDVGVCCKTPGCAAQLTVDEKDKVRRAAGDAGYFDAPAKDANASAGRADPTPDGRWQRTGPDPTRWRRGGGPRVRQRPRGSRRDLQSAVDLPGRLPAGRLRALRAARRRGGVQRGLRAERRSGDLPLGRRLLPAGCTVADDSDCGCACGDGTVDDSCGETCDPLSACPTACAPVGCTLRRLANPGTCRARCVNDALQTACIGGDGCCPPACNANNDSDCPAACGNGVIESGEACDPPGSCPASCPPLGCTRRKLTGSAATCTARCADDVLQTACASGDGCCPPACNANNDSDCACTCGNGRSRPRARRPAIRCPAARPPARRSAASCAGWSTAAPARPSA